MSERIRIGDVRPGMVLAEGGLVRRVERGNGKVSLVCAGENYVAAPEDEMVELAVNEYEKHRAEIMNALRLGVAVDEFGTISVDELDNIASWLASEGIGKVSQ